MNNEGLASLVIKLLIKTVDVQYKNTSMKEHWELLTNPPTIQKNLLYNKYSISKLWNN